MTANTRSYPVPSETMPSLNLSHHFHDLMEIRSFFEGRGIETKNTRIERYGTYLERSLSDGAESVDALPPRVREAIITLVDRDTSKLLK